MKRFFVEQELKSGKLIQLSQDESKHATRVMRLENGAEILVTNGRGVEATAKIFINANQAGAHLEVLSLRIIENLGTPQIELVQAMLKGPKMDWLVEKVTELGIRHLQPATSRYCVALEGKEDRWKRIIQAAMKQSGNVFAPQIHPLRNLSDIIEEYATNDAEKFILSPGAPLSLLQRIQNTDLSVKTRIVLAIGPEGGFSAEEETAMIGAGFKPCSLSKNILRGETAAIAAAAILSHAIDFT